MPPWVVLLALVFGVAGLLIGNTKGHPVWGFFLGAILSVAGVVIIAVTKPSPEFLARKEADRIRAQQAGAAIIDAERGRQQQ